MNQVLVVDDDPKVCDLTARALAEVNLGCDTARDGREAFDRFDPAMHTVVVSDLRMPGKNGHALAVGLLSRPDPPRVVVVTGLSEQRLVCDLMSLGVEDIFIKPVCYSALAMKLLSIVEGDKRRQSLSAPSRCEAASPKLIEIEQTLADMTAMFAESLAGVFEFEEQLSSPPKAVSDFITRFARIEEEAADYYADVYDERRVKQRARCSRAAMVVPVNRRFEPTGEPFMAAIRDVSEAGIRLLHTRAITAEYLAISWRAETLQYTDIRLVMKVARCQAMSPFYNIAGQFVLAD